MSYGISGDPTTTDILERYPVISLFCDNLHGSGIDYDWSAEESKKEIICYNSFHAMNECGMYDRTIGFAVHFPKNNLYDCQVKCTDDRYGWNKYMLADYLYESVHYEISECIQALKEEWPIKSGVRIETICKVFPVKKDVV
jgi:hypothetical protein